MADDVPVYDVLCEAMEYLCKLGVNLRVRSENLRAKKIRRDKLRNAHAVQKAASKVLLICELSKKSLVNVESGVKQVLKQVEAAQAAIASTSTTESSPKTKHGKEYHYFVYKSHKLKIAKKIPVKHFLSVQVQVRSMPTSLQDKYPVYHNCNLYRLRKTLEKKEEVLHKHRTSSECQSNLLEKPEKYKHNEIKDGNDLDCTLSSEVQRTRDKESLEKEIQATDVKENNDITNDADDNRKKDKNNLSNSDDNSLPDPERCSRKKNVQRRISEYCQKEKRKKACVIDTSEEDITQQESVARKDNTAVDSIVSDNENSDKHVMHKAKKPKLDESHSELEDKENHNRNPAQNENQSDNNDQPICTESESAKPMIKCVSINKLLKPDVLEKIEGNPSTHKSDKVKKSLKLYYNKNNKDGQKKSHKNTERSMQCKSVDSEDEYWNTKRKEVKAFKSKNFVINVTKLPKLSTSFLLKHNIKRIIQYESVVCEIIDESTHLPNKKKSTEDCTNTVDQSKNKQIPCDIDKVKNSLLNDSDSDLRSPQNLERTQEEENIKNALLNDSDSDNNSSVSAASVPACIVNKHAKEKTFKNNDKNSDNEKNSNDGHDKSDSSNNEKLTVAKKKKNNIIKVKLPLRDKKKKIHKSKKNENETNLASNMDDSEKNLVETDKNEYDVDKNGKMAVENDDTNKIKEITVRTNESNINEKIMSNTNENENILDRPDEENENIEENKEVIEKSGENEKEVEPDEHTGNNLCDNNEKCSEKDGKNMSASEEMEKKVDEGTSLNNIKDQILPKNLDENKRALLNSSDDNQSKTPDKRKMQDSITPRSKRKHIMESMHAKKMLLTYSSSSETEDEQLRGVLKDIKDSLLKGVSSSDEEQTINKSSHRRKLMVSSDSDESAQKEKKELSPSHQTSDRSSKEKSEIESTKSGAADTMDTQSNSSRSKMGRSKANRTGRSSSRSSDSQDTRDKDIDG